MALALIMVLVLVAWPGETQSALAAKKRKAPPEPVRLGIFFPMTGIKALAGQSAYKGLMLARKHRPLVLTDRPVVLLLSDTGSRPESAAKLVRNLIIKDKAHALIGGLTARATVTAAGIIEENKRPAVTPSAVSAALTSANSYLFSAVNPPEREAGFAARFARESLKALDGAVIGQAGDALALARAGRFEARFKASGGRRVFLHQAASAKDLSWVDGLIGQTPDVVFITGGAEFTARTAKALVQAGFKRPLIGVSEAAGPELIKLGGTAVEGLYLVGRFDPAGVRTALGRRFVRACRTEHPILEPGHEAAMAYLAYNLILDAVQQAGSTDGQAVATALAGFKNHSGLLGDISLAGGITDKPAVMMMIKRGRIHWLSTLSP